MAFDIYDSVITSPTNTFAVFNALVPSASLQDGNLKLYSSSSNAYAYANMSVTTGKWYFEYVYTATPSTNGGGGITFYDSFTGSPENNGTRYIPTTGYVYLNGSHVATAATYSTDDVIGIFVDTDASPSFVRYFKNNVAWVTLNPTSLGSVPFYFFLYNYTGTQYGNFGQDSSFGGNKTTGSANATDANGIGDFYYSPPTGALALCTANIQNNLAIDPNVDDLPEDNFKAVTWQGNSTTNTQIDTGGVGTGTGFKPDLIWWKNRDYGHNHGIIDSVRGVHNRLYPDATSASYEETSAASKTVLSFEDTGFKIHTEAGINNSSYKYCAWCWKAGGAPSGATSATGSAKRINSTGTQDDTSCEAIRNDALGTTNGTQNTNPGENTANHMYTPSAMSINQQSGFSILTYEGHANNTYRRIPHGLNKKPDFAIFKQLTDSGYSWRVYHKSIGATHSLQLESTNAAADRHYDWNDTEPTNKYFTVNTDGALQQDGKNFVAYIWTEIPGFSAFGSYTGNGNGSSTTDGPFVYTGFRPAFLIIKQSSSSGNSWWITDATRSRFNGDTPNAFRTNEAYAENTANSLIMPDYLSNGFKIRGWDSAVNTSGSTYVYMAFAEMPFKYSATNAR